MTPTESSFAWLAVAGADGARLLRASLAESRVLQLDEVCRVANRWGTPPSPQQSADESRRRYVRDLAIWADQQISTHRIDELLLFAPGWVTTSLDKALSPRVRKHATLHDGDYTHCSDSELRDNAAIGGVVRAVLEPPSGV